MMDVQAIFNGVEVGCVEQVARLLAQVSSEARALALAQVRRSMSGCLRFQVWGFRVQGLGFGIWGEGSGFEGWEFEVVGSGVWLEVGVSDSVLAVVPCR